MQVVSILVILEVDIKPTDDLSGQYSLTIKSDASGTPDNLTTGQYLVFQGQEITGGYITYATHKLKVTA